MKVLLLLFLQVSIFATHRRTHRTPCFDKDNGYYEQGACSNRFNRCLHGEAITYQCRKDGQVFQEANQRCVNPDTLTACQASSRHRPSGHRGQNYRNHHRDYDVQEDTGAFDPHFDNDDEMDFGLNDPESRNQQTNNFCWDKTDGRYEAGPCINTYIKCKRHRPQYYTCRQPGTIYNKDHSDCVSIESVPRCLSTHGPNLKSNCESSDLSEETVHALWPCHTSFGVCYRGSFSTMNCQSGRVFDAHRGKCVSPKYNRECPVLEHQSESTLDQYCQLYAETKYTRNFVIPYGACSDRMIDCSRNPPYVVHCRPGEVFDVYKKRTCLPVNQVPECSIGTTAPTGWTSFGKFDQSYSRHLTTWDQNHVRPIADVLPRSDSDGYVIGGFCSNRERGIYYQIKKGHKCPTEFRYCNSSADEGHIFYCDSGYFVDKNFRRCVRRPECELDRFEEDDASLMAHDICTNKRDGVYEIGQCEPNFILCTNKEGARMDCEDGTAFSQAFGQCIPTFKHSQCLPIKQQSDDPVVQSMDPVGVNLHVPENFCASAPHPSVFGLYGCHRFFFYCSSSGFPLSQTCEFDNEAFDAVQKRCLPRNAHSACTEYGPIQPMEPLVTDIHDLPITNPDDDEVASMVEAGLSFTSCAVNGEFRVHPQTCTKFLRCDNGLYVSFKCPPTTVFVPKISVCDHARNHKPCS